MESLSRVRRRSRRRVVADALLSCTREHDWATAPAGLESAIREVGLSPIAEAALFHGVTGCVWRSVLPLGPAVDPEGFEKLRDAHDRLMVTHLTALRTLADAAVALDGLGVTWALLKGPALGSDIYIHPDLRSYSDVDILVEPSRFRDVIVGLQDAGFSLSDRDWLLASHLTVGETTLEHPSGMALDLHWHLVNEESVRRGLALDTDEILRRRRRVEMPLGPVWIFEDADAFTYLAIHCGRHGGDRLKWLKDLEQMALQDRVPWDTVVARSRAAGAQLLVATVLQRAVRAFGFPVPAGILDELVDRRDRPWLAINRLTDRLPPVAAARGGRSLSRMAMRATRRHLGASSWELLRAIVLAVTSPLSRHRDTSRSQGTVDDFLQTVDHANS